MELGPLLAEHHQECEREQVQDLECKEKWWHRLYDRRVPSLTGGIRISYIDCSHPRTSYVSVQHSRPGVSR
jgi:hypothetical protein